MRFKKSISIFFTISLIFSTNVGTAEASKESKTFKQGYVKSVKTEWKGEDIILVNTDMSSVEAQLEMVNRPSCPAYGRISSLFGYRSSPGGIGSTNHQGVDVALPSGNNVYSVKDGVVVSAGYEGGYGYAVEVQHDGFSTFYAHNSKILVSVGERVVGGQVIALSGNSGSSTGSHSHIEKRVEGHAVDPVGLLEYC